jgi:hypothetical protein
LRPTDQLPEARPRRVSRPLPVAGRPGVFALNRAANPRCRPDRPPHGSRRYRHQSCQQHPYSHSPSSLLDYLRYTASGSLVPFRFAQDFGATHRTGPATAGFVRLHLRLRDRESNSRGNSVLLLVGLGLWARLLLEPTILIGLFVGLGALVFSSPGVGPGSTGCQTDRAAGALAVIDQDEPRIGRRRGRTIVPAHVRSDSKEEGEERRRKT